MAAAAAACATDGVIPAWGRGNLVSTGGMGRVQKYQIAGYEVHRV